MLRTLLILILSVSAAHALEWTELSAREQELLLPFAEDWDKLPADSQERLRAGALLWASMPAEERKLARQRFHEWQQLAPEQRDRIRERYQRFRALPPAQQRILKEVFRRFQALPAHQRAQLRERFEGMSAAEKRAFLQGLRVGQQSQQASDRHPLRDMPTHQQRWFRIVALSLSPTARERLTQMLRSGDAGRWNQLQNTLEPMTIAEREQYLLSLEHD